MNKIYFGICLHFHQPVGNFDNIFERAYKNCYKPFFDVYQDYPDIKMSLHFSGCLLDYFEDAHPEFLGRVKKMTQNGQVEIVGGGYYEPIFTSIPREDRIGQIKMMANYIKKRFKKTAQGMWTPERVWVPELARDFNKAGMKYTILDDEHFIKAGLKEEELFGYFTTGEKNKEIAVFPSSKKLRYMIPFKMPAEIMDYFKYVGANNHSPLLTYGDDAEKFGEWPFTYDWVYKQNWLRKFFDELMKNKDWIKTIKLSDYIKTNRPVKKINIPEASYQEMMEWSGGSWMNFLKKYPETNHMVHKMQYVSEKVNRKQKTEDRRQTILAFKELYKGQCNCAYWHGVFGGIYLYHLRKAVYEHLINAEKILDKILHKGKRSLASSGKDRDARDQFLLRKNWLEIRGTDFYKDDTRAFIIENKDLSIYIDPNMGGVIRELDYRALSINLVNTLARHEEAYHKKIKEKINSEANKTGVHTIHEDVKAIGPGVKAEFEYDDHMRACLIDHLGDFMNEPYDAKKTKDKVVLTRKGSVDGKSVLLTKEIGLDNKEIKISYSLKNLSKRSIDTVFGIEFNLTMPYLNSNRYNYFADGRVLTSLNEQGIVSKPGVFSIKDSEKELDVNFTFSEKPENLHYFPVKTISQSERAYELNFQSSCIIPRWHIKIDVSRNFFIAFTMHMCYK